MRTNLNDIGTRSYANSFDCTHRSRNDSEMLERK